MIYDKLFNNYRILYILWHIITYLYLIKYNTVKEQLLYLNQEDQKITLIEI